MNDKLIEIFEFLKNEKCKNVVAFDLTENGDEKFFIIASCQTAEENKKIADDLTNNFELVDEKDGYHKGEWIILPFNKLLVHLFTNSSRAKYNLDRLYKSKEIDIAKFLKKKKSK